MLEAFAKVRNMLRPVHSQEERRLHERALSHWRKLKERHERVPLNRFDWQSVEDHRIHGFLLKAGEKRARFVHIGPVLRDEANLLDKTTVSLEDVPDSSLLARFSRKYETALAEGEPVADSYEFVTPMGYRVLSRGVLLPLSSDGEVNDHVYGVISWKSERVQQP